MTFLKVAEKVLEEAKYPLTHRQIWEVAKKKGLDGELQSGGKTPANSMAAQLSTSVRKSESPFKVTSIQPIKYWLKSRDVPPASQGQEIAECENDIDSRKVRKFSERDLHPLLVRFAYDEFGAYTKTIYHEKSHKSKKGQDKWIHPDIVGAHFPFRDYKNEAILNLSTNLGASTYVIYAFEIKIRLDWHNLKESYFQAVSNSSFANEGYLVVFEDIDSEVLDEVRRLRDRFGIGLIKLEAELMKSSVIFPAQPKALDFKMMDALMDKNSNFENFIDNFMRDADGDEDRIGIKHYDQILSDDELTEYIGKKKIENL